MNADRSKILIVLILAIACGRSEPLTTRELVGQYYLYVNSEYTNPNQPDDRLLLKAGGTYEHTFTSGAVHRSSSGAWRVSGTRVVINNWQDYAGITSLQPRGERELDFIVFTEGTPATIVLDSDQNIFYDRRPHQHK
jgi:hypothetical protein